MKHRIVLIAAALVCTAVAWSQGPGLTQEQKASIEKEITAAHTEMVAAANRLSAEGWSKFVSDSFQERLGRGNLSPTDPGKEALVKLITELFAARKEQKIIIQSLKVHPLSADLAYSVYLGGGSATFKKSGRFGGWGAAMTMVWRKENAGWRIIHVHESNW